MLVCLDTSLRTHSRHTRSRRLVDIGKSKGWKGVVAGTRKLTPGFRLVEKHAMKGV